MPHLRNKARIILDTKTGKQRIAVGDYVLKVGEGVVQGPLTAQQLEMIDGVGHTSRSGPSASSGRSSSSSSGAARSGGSATAGSPPREQRSALVGQLAMAGFTFPFDITPFINKAIRDGQGVEYAYALIIKSGIFRRYYPGIFRANGTLKMTPAEYEAYVDAASATARSAGFSISRAQVGRLIANSVSAEEFAFRVQAAAQIRANPHILQSVNAVLRNAGLSGIRTAQDAFNFFTGRATKRVYDLYESATTMAAARSAGLSLDARQARSLAGQTAEVVPYDEAEERFKRIADELKVAGIELKEFGITQRELQTIEFGGPNRAALADRAERALRQRRAALENDIAQPSMRLTPYGRPVVPVTQDAGF